MLDLRAVKVAAERKALLRAVQSGLPALVSENGTDRTGHRVFTVPSGSRDGRRYLVRADASGQPVTCTCEQWSYRHLACKHMASTWLVTHPGARVKLPAGGSLDPGTGEVAAAQVAPGAARRPVPTRRAALV